MVKKIKAFIVEYERQLFVAGLFFGFVWDSFTLRRIDLFYENLVLLGYLLVAGTAIVLIYISQSPLRIPKVMERWAIILPLTLQIAFGALFSAFVVFYVRGSSFATSWVFLLVLAVLLVGNEFFRERYYRITFQISIFYIALLSYLIFSIPVLIGKIGTGVFLISIAVSLLIMYGSVWTLLKISQTPGINYIQTIRTSVISIAVIIVLLFFANIIPPLPLSLKEIAVAHEVKKVDDGYILELEEQPWYSIHQYFRTTFHQTDGEGVSVFSSVFSPTDLDTQIFHHWQYHDGRRWVSRDKISFEILGGRDGGYRGYTTKSNVEEGLWRVDVTTPSGQVIGRKTFTVRSIPESANTELEKF